MAVLSQALPSRGRVEELQQQVSAMAYSAAQGELWQQQAEALLAGTGTHLLGAEGGGASLAGDANPNPNNPNLHTSQQGDGLLTSFSQIQRSLQRARDDLQRRVEEEVRRG